MKKIILILVIAAFALIAGSYFYLGIETKREYGWFVREGVVEGSAVIANGLPYTLNYDQQEGVLNEINNSKKVRNPQRSDYTPGSIESIVIYLFDRKSRLVLTPITNDFSLFKVDAWKEPYFLRLRQPMDLEIILESAYDK